MVRQNFHTADRLEACDKITHLAQVVLVVGHTRHEDVANPHFLAVVGQIARHVEDVRVIFAGQLHMQLAVELLQVEHEQVGQAHQLIEAVEPLRVAAEGLTCRVHAGVHALFLHQPEELGHEVQLHQRFTAGNGDAAVVLPVRLVANRLVEQLACGHFLRLADRRRAPCVGVMAEFAAQRTAVEENGAANAGAIHQRERFKRMNTSLDVGIRIAHVSKLLARDSGG